MAMGKFLLNYIPLVKFCVVENKSSWGSVLVCSQWISNKLDLIIFYKKEMWMESCKEVRLLLNQITKIIWE